jgi:chromosome segregation ATPase
VNEFATWATIFVALITVTGVVVTALITARTTANEKRLDRHTDRVKSLETRVATLEDEKAAVREELFACRLQIVSLTQEKNILELRAEQASGLRNAEALRLHEVEEELRTEREHVRQLEERLRELEAAKALVETAGEPEGGSR